MMWKRRRVRKRRGGGKGGKKENKKQGKETNSKSNYNADIPTERLHDSSIIFSPLFNLNVLCQYFLSCPELVLGFLEAGKGNPMRILSFCINFAQNEKWISSGWLAGGWLSAEWLSWMLSWMLSLFLMTLSGREGSQRSSTFAWVRALHHCMDNFGMLTLGTMSRGRPTSHFAGDDVRISSFASFQIVLSTGYSRKVFEN